MTTVCAIGDSHLAALKLGWNTIQSRHPGIRVVFFGAPGGNLNDLSVSGGSLVATSQRLRKFIRQTSGGLDAIEPGYDRFLVCGMKFAVFMVERLYQKFRTETEAKDDRRPISNQCLLLAAQGCLRRSTSIGTVEKLRRVTAAPIGLIPVPFRAEGWVAEQPARNLDPHLVAQTFADAAKGLGEELDFRPFFPPAAMLHSPVQTKAEYSENSLRLQGNNKPHREEDRLHMNPRYGADLLDTILADPLFAAPASHTGCAA